MTFFSFSQLNRCCHPRLLFLLRKKSEKKFLAPTGCPKRGKGKNPFCVTVQRPKGGKLWSQRFFFTRCDTHEKEKERAKGQSKNVASQQTRSEYEMPV